MVDIDTEVKEWGNSLGVGLPRASLSIEGIGPGDRVRVHIEKASSRDAWGFLNELPGAPISMAQFEAQRLHERRRERARGRRGAP